MKKVLGIALLVASSLAYTAEKQITKVDIMGVWKLTKFVLVDDNGKETDWCEGAYGTIAYAKKLMSVAINCKSTSADSGAQKLSGMLFYSGPYSFNKKKQQVTHKVANFSHESLHKNYKRLVEMDSTNDLRLVGFLGEGKKVIVEWKRLERFKSSKDLVVGTWKLVGSENEVAGSNEVIPFCTGFYGTIMYTPGGYAAVSINCKKKINPNIEEPADQFGRKYFYSGSYYEDGNSNLIQTPDNASEESHIGHSFLRKMSIKNNILTLEGENGSKFLAKWKRINTFN